MRDIIIAGSGSSIHGFAFPKRTPIMAISSGIYHVPECAHFVSCDRPVNFNRWVTDSDRFDKHVPANSFLTYWNQYQRVTAWPVEAIEQPGFLLGETITQSGPHPRNHSLLFGVQVASQLGYTRCIFIGADLLEREHWPISDVLARWHPIARGRGIEWVNASPVSTLREWMPEYEPPLLTRGGVTSGASPRDSFDLAEATQPCH